MPGGTPRTLPVSVVAQLLDVIAAAEEVPDLDDVALRILHVERAIAAVVLLRPADLGETTFLDSTALGVLIGTVKRLRSRDGRLTIVNVDQNIAKTFEITGLDQIFTILPTRDDAIAALDDAASPS